MKNQKSVLPKKTNTIVVYDDMDRVTKIAV